MMMILSQMLVRTATPAFSSHPLARKLTGIALGAGLFLQSLSAGWAAPANDAFGNRGILPADLPLSVSGSNAGATAELAEGEPRHEGQTPRQSVWWTWRAPSQPGIAVVDLSGTTFRPLLGVYTGKHFADFSVVNGAFSTAPDGTGRIFQFPFHGGADYQIALDGQGGASGEIRLKLRVIYAPEITQHPERLVISERESATFRADAAGPEPLRFQWRLNGAILPGQTNKVLTIGVAEGKDAGFYSLEVSNEYGGATSSSAELIVDPKPRILKHPESLSVGSGATASFSVTAVGRLPLQYRWEFNDAPVPGQTLSNLVLSGVRLSHQGNYRVVVANTFGSVTSSNAVLTVSAQPPAPEIKPTNIVAVVGETLAIDLARDPGSQPISYQWRHNGLDLPGHIAGNLRLQLTVTNQSGLYTLRGMNEIGEGISKPAQVRVVAPPPNDHFINRITIPATNTPVTGYNFGATRENGEPNHAGESPVHSVWWTWTAPEVGIATVDLSGSFDAARFGVYQGPAVDALQQVQHLRRTGNHLMSFLTTNAMEYPIAVDGRGNALGDIRLLVQFTTEIPGPNITLQCNSLRIRACETATFSVDSQAVAPVNYQWTFNGVPIAGATNRILSITNVSAAQIGEYQAIMSNLGGSTNSRVATLDVYPGPDITSQPQDLSLRVCQNGTLRVQARGCDPLQYQWRFNDVNLPGATNATLALSNVSTNDAGKYSVVVSTDVSGGAITSRVAQVTVRPLPEISQQPLDLTVTNCATVTLSVRATESCNQLLAYQWFFNDAPMAGMTSSNLLLANVDTNHIGRYFAVVANAAGAVTSRVAQFRVNPLPRLVNSTFPADRMRIREGDPFHLEVLAENCEPMTYQWFFRSVTNNVYSTNLVGLTNLVLVTNQISIATPSGTILSNVIQTVPQVLGVQSNRLVFHRSATNQNGHYYVVVANRFGAVTSRVAQVQVLVPPENDYFANRIRIDGTNTIVTGHNIIATREPGEPPHVPSRNNNRSVWWTWTAPNEPGYLTVDLSGSPFDTLLAFYSGNSVTNLTLLQNDDQSGSGSSSKITEHPLQENSTVQIAVDGVRDAEGAIRLNLVYLADTNPPVILRQPQSIASPINTTVTFDVDVKRNPYLRYQWKYNGADLPGQTNRALTLPNIQKSHEGNYSVLIRNKYGSVLSENGKLTLGGVIRGMVTDASNKNPIPGARVAVGEIATFTDQNGNYELFGVEPGVLHADFDAENRVVGLNVPVRFRNRSTFNTVTLTGTASGYFPYENTQVEVISGKSIKLEFSMSPILEGGMRFVLNWGENPADLDAHLVTPSIEGKPPFTVFYPPANRGSTNSHPYARLDVDHERSFGPETITASQLFPGRYRYFIKKANPNAVGHLRSSGAVVKIYTAQGLVRSIEVPTSGDGLYWHVCDVDGATRNILLVNRIVSTDPTLLNTTGAPTPDPLPSSTLAGLQSASTDAPANTFGSFQTKAVSPVGASYAWDFGDGQTATTFEPTHSYARPGCYTVGLTLSGMRAGSPASDTEIKECFILVTNAAPEIRLVQPAPDLTHRQPATILLEADARDRDGSVARVEFYANNRLLGADTSPPFTWTARDLLDGNYTFTARAYDQFDAQSVSAPVTNRVRDLSGQILILRNRPDPEIDLMADLLRDDGYTYQILDQERLTLDMLATFELIIWVDAGQLGLTPNTIQLLQQAWGAGKHLYFVGDRLLDRQGLSAEHGKTWSELLHLERPPNFDPARDTSPAILLDFEEKHPLIYDGKFGTLWDFSCPTPVQGGKAAGRFGETVVGRAAGLDAIVTYEDPLRRNRSATHPFRLRHTTADAGQDARTLLFRNTVWWLLYAFHCPTLDLYVLPHTETKTIAAGDELTYQLRIIRERECAGRFVVVSNALPAHVQFVGATNSAGTVETTGNGSVVFAFKYFDFGELKVSFTVRPTLPGTLTNNISVWAGAERNLSNNHTALIVEVEGALPPVEVNIAPAPDGSLQLNLLNPLPGKKYILEYTPSLSAPVTWKFQAELVNGSISIPKIASAPHGFYRVRIE